MLEAKNQRELVRVPVRRAPLKEEKATGLGTEMPNWSQRDWEIPRRWRVY